MRQAGKALRGVALLVSALLAVTLNLVRMGMAATITVVNEDQANEGFNDSTPATPIGGNQGLTVGEQRLIAFQYAADLWAELIESEVEIRVSASFDRLECTSTRVVLGMAGPNNVWRDFEGAPIPNTFYPDALANSLAGLDLEPQADDVLAIFNSALGAGCSFPARWYYGLDAGGSFDDPDLVTTVLHELGHGLGFLTLVELATGKKFMGVNDAYMRHLEDHRTGMLYPEMTDAERIQASTATGDLHWVGPFVIEASDRLSNGADPNGHVRMYAPRSQQQGGSVSHFDTTLNPNELMEPFDTGARQDVGLTFELFRDLGWGVKLPVTVTPTPSATSTRTVRPTPTQRRTSTQTRTVTATSPPTPTWTPRATRTRTATWTFGPDGSPTPLPPDVCGGDCNDDRVVTVDELVLGIDIMLGRLTLLQCLVFDVSENGHVSVDELLIAVDNAMQGCPPSLATPTPTATATQTSIPPQSPTPSATLSPTADGTATPTSQPTATQTFPPTVTATPSPPGMPTPTNTMLPAIPESMAVARRNGSAWR